MLLADTSAPEGASKDDAITAQVRVCLLMVQQVLRRFAEDGLDAALWRKEQLNRNMRVLDGAAGTFLVTTKRSAPPKGQKLWSLHLLQDKVVQAGY